MDPALHVRRGHGQRCVYSARAVGTVCVRCVAEVLTLPTVTRTDPSGQRYDSSVLALTTTKARYAKALVELVRDQGAAPDVADHWGHVLVAASIDAIVTDDTQDKEGVTPPCVESVARIVATAARVDGGELLDAAVDRVLAHLTQGTPTDHTAGQRPEQHPHREGGLPPGILGLPSPPGASNQLINQNTRPYPAFHDSQVSNEDARYSQRVAVQDTYREFSGGQPTQHRDPSTTYRDSQSTASLVNPMCRESQNSVGLYMPLPGLARRQPRFTQRTGNVGSEFAVPVENEFQRDVPIDAACRKNAQPQLLRVLATLLRLECFWDAIPSSFREPAPAPGFAPSAGIAALVAHLRGDGNKTQSSFRVDTSPQALRSGDQTETVLAALDATAAFVARADAGNAHALNSLRAGNAVAATALALGAATAGAAAGDNIRPERNFSVFPTKKQPSADPSDATEDSLVLALQVIDALARRCRVDLDAMTVSSASASASDRAKNTLVSPLAETLRRGMLSPRLSGRAAACACLTSLVAGQHPTGVGRLVNCDVLEHVFEVLRDASRDFTQIRNGARPVMSGGIASRADADLTQCTALECCLSLILSCPFEIFAPRLVFGIDVLAATLTKSVQSKDTDVRAISVQFARAVAEFGDPGNIPTTSAGRLCDALLEVYDDCLPVKARNDKNAYTGQGAAKISFHTQGYDQPDPDNPNHLHRQHACAAIVALLNWPSLRESGVSGDDVGEAYTATTRARRMFECLAQDVASNLSRFGGGLSEPENGSRVQSPYRQTFAGNDGANENSTPWDLPPGAAQAMRIVLRDHFDVSDIVAVENTLRERVVHVALASGLRRLTHIADRARNASRAVDWRGTEPQLSAVADAISTYGQILGGAVEETSDALPVGSDFFSEDTNDVSLIHKHSDQIMEGAKQARTRLARDLVAEGVLASSILAAAAEVFRSFSDVTACVENNNPHSAPNFGGFENSQSTDDTNAFASPTSEHSKLLENFVGVLLLALDDAGLDPYGNNILNGSDEFGDKKTFACFGVFANELGYAPSPAALACVFAHIKYQRLGDCLPIQRDDILLTRIAPTLAHCLSLEVPNGDELFLESVGGVTEILTSNTYHDPRRPPADDSIIFSFVTACVLSEHGALRTLPEFVLQTLTRRVARRGALESFNRKTEGHNAGALVGFNPNLSLSPPQNSDNPFVDDTFASFTEFVCSGSCDAQIVLRILADCTQFGTDQRVAKGVTSVLLKGLGFAGTRKWFREQSTGKIDTRENGFRCDATRDSDDDANINYDYCTPSRFVEGLCLSSAATALLALRVVGGSACVDSVDSKQDTPASSIEKWDASKAVLFVLRRRPCSLATIETTKDLWPYVLRLLSVEDECHEDDNTDGNNGWTSQYTSRMEIAHACALVVFDAGASARGILGDQESDSSLLRAFTLSCSTALQTTLSPFTRLSSRLQASYSNIQHVANAATATMRALGSAIAVALREEIETGGLVENCASAAAPAARALKEWHAQVVEQSSGPISGRVNPEEETTLRAVRDARRAAITLVSILAAASRSRVGDVKDENRNLTVEVLADVADDATDGVVALDALAALALSCSGQDEVMMSSKTTSLITQAGRVALCCGSDAVRDAGATCLWAAAMRKKEEPRGDANALGALVVLDEPDGSIPTVTINQTSEHIKQETNPFDDISGNWEASLLEDWLSGVESSDKSPKENTSAPFVCPAEGRLRLAASLASTSPDAFRRHVLNSPEATIRLIKHALGGLPANRNFPMSKQSEQAITLCSPGALAVLLELFPGKSKKSKSNALPMHELHGVRTALVEIRHVTAGCIRDGLCTTGSPNPSSADTKKAMMLKDGSNFALRLRFGGDTFFGQVVSAHPKLFPGNNSNVLSILDTLVLTLDCEIRKRGPGSPYKRR